MIYRWAEGGSFEPLADDLVAQNVDLIVAVGSPATRAVKERTTRIPIVIVDVGDPVAPTASSKAFLAQAEISLGCRCNYRRLASREYSI